MSDARHLSPEALIAALDAGATRRETRCGEGTMVWREWGAGPTLVLLHGGFGSWLHWVRNVDTLARTHRVLAADLPGLGESALPPVIDDPAAIGEVIAHGVETLVGAGEPLHVAAFSFGGMLSGHVVNALARPVATLTLVGSSGLGIVREPMELRRRTPGMSEAERAEALDYNIRTLMLHHETRIDALARHVHAVNDSNARLRSRRMSLGDSLRQVLPGLDVRLKAIWGEHDATAVPRLEERRELLLAIHPETDFRIIPDAGHWVQYEAAQVFDAMLSEMIAAP